MFFIMSNLLLSTFEYIIVSRTLQPTTKKKVGFVSSFHVYGTTYNFFWLQINSPLLLEWVIRNHILKKDPVKRVFIWDSTSKYPVTK